MLFPSMKNGIEFETFINEHISPVDNENGWQLLRSLDKNHKMKISGVVISPKLTNRSIGIALAKNANIIVTIRNMKESTYILHNDIYETLYKNDIFVFSLGMEWIFSTNFGKELLTLIFGGEQFSSWNEDIDSYHCLISLNNFSTLKTITNRLKGKLTWIHPKIGEKSDEIKIKNLLYIRDSVDYTAINKLQPEAIICNTINSDLIDYCWNQKIILIWVPLDQILNEISREIMFYFSYNNKISNIHFSYIEAKPVERSEI